MPDFFTETAITLQEATEVIPGKPHVTSVYRWCKYGVRGVKLESHFVGGRRFTTKEALTRFFEATTEASEVPGSRRHSEPSHIRRSRADQAASKVDELLGPGSQSGN